jgi:hypothetical protein
MTAYLGQKSLSPISVIRREYIELLAQLAPGVATRIRVCSAQLIDYLIHWSNWRVKEGYRDRWVYQPLRYIRKDLMDVYSLHVIRNSLDLLQELNLLSIRKNERGVNRRNGQEKTHQYLLHVSRLKEALDNRSHPSKAETIEISSSVNVETLGVDIKTSHFNVETPRFTVETHTQIPTLIPPTDSSTLSKEREKTDFVQELEDPWEIQEEEVEQDSLALCNDIAEILQEEEVKSEDQFSAALVSKRVEVVQNTAPTPKCVEVVQADTNHIKPLPKLKSDSEALLRSADRTSGFRSQEERDGFYQSLLELGKNQGKKSPVAWAGVIVKAINAGEPCQYLSEYREGLQVGRCEQQEWEVAPGQPFEQFVSYLKTRNKKTGMSDEEAIATAYQQLKDVNLARSQWESFKRSIVRYSEDWEKQKRLGVSSAYLPPELLPHREVTLEQAATAIASLQSGCAQLQGLATPKLNCVTAELEPVKELPSESAVVELEPVTVVDDLEPVKELPSESAIVKPEPAAVVTDLEPMKELPSESAVVEPEPVADAADLEPVKELPTEPEPVIVSVGELQEKLNSPFALFRSLARTMAKTLGYRIEEDLVLPAGEEMPDLEHLRSLLDTDNRGITAKKIQRLVERNPQWGFYFDEFGELWGF